MSPGLLSDLSIFVLALLVGFEVISKVPATLHTPLMSAANSIHGVVLVGAILIATTADNVFGYILGFVAAAFAAMNVVGGYVVTDRMLGMFKKRPVSRRRAGAARGASVSAFDTVIHLVYLAAATCFVLGLHLMNSPATARRGNQVSAAGMIAAIVATLGARHPRRHRQADGVDRADRRCSWSAVSPVCFSARRVAMTAMPQLVSLFNAVGGGAAAIVAISRLRTPARRSPGIRTSVPSITVPTVLDVIIGAVTFAGSLIASGKLQGTISSSPIVFPGVRVANVLLTVVMVGGGVYLIGFHTSSAAVDIIVLSAVLRGRAAVRRHHGAADRRRRHAGGYLAAERVHRHRRRDGRLRHRQRGADHLRRAGRCVRRHPHEADGRRDEPLDRQHHHRRLRHRRLRRSRSAARPAARCAR